MRMKDHQTDQHFGFGLPAPRAERKFFVEAAQSVVFSATGQAHPIGTSEPLTPS